MSGFWSWTDPHVFLVFFCCGFIRAGTNYGNNADTPCEESAGDDGAGFSIHEFNAAKHLNRLLEVDKNDYFVLKELCILAKKPKDALKYGERAYTLVPNPEIAYHIAEQFVSETDAVVGYAPSEIRSFYAQAEKWYRNAMSSSQMTHVPSMLALTRVLLEAECPDGERESKKALVPSIVISEPSRRVYGVLYIARSARFSSTTARSSRGATEV